MAVGLKHMDLAGLTELAKKKRRYREQGGQPIGRCWGVRGDLTQSIPEFRDRPLD